MAEPRRAFVCGHPIAHSRSPLIHGHWLRALGIREGHYHPVDIAPAEFVGFLSSLGAQGFVGGNVTIPHKEAAWRLVERCDDEAEAIGAVNTVWLEDGLLCGSNTDAYGFAANLDQTAPAWREVETAIVLGAGGASRAIIHALATAGTREILLVNRTVERARELQRQFGSAVSVHSWDAVASLLPGAGLLVNCSAAGMENEASIALDLSAMPRDAIVTDIVYTPLETALLREDRRCGLVAVDGLGMLLHQAVPGFERWFGRRPEVTEALRAEIVADLEQAR